MKKKIFEDIYKKFHSVLEEHHKYFTTELLVFTLVPLVTVFVLICFSVYLHPEFFDISYNFTRNEGSITILSTAILSVASLLAYVCFFINPTADRRQRIFFLIIGLALTFLALDEAINLHEQVGKAIDTVQSMRKIATKLHISTWNDIILVMYGIIALPLLVYFLPVTLQIPCIPEYFLAALLCFAIHISIDFIADPPTPLSYVFEESMKVYISTFLALGLFSGLAFLIKTKKKKIGRGDFQANRIFPAEE